MSTTPNVLFFSAVDLGQAIGHPMHGNLLGLPVRSVRPTSDGLRNKLVWLRRTTLPMHYAGISPM